MNRMIPNSTLKLIDNVGHCPHLSAPGASVAATEEFLARL
jgi:sigma-B regulation protein RsbQ